MGMIVTWAIEARRPIKHRKESVTFLNKLSSRQVKLSIPRASKRSIAVLPFESLSDEALRLEPDNPFLKNRKAGVAFLRRGDAMSSRAA